MSNIVLMWRDYDMIMACFVVPSLDKFQEVYDEVIPGDMKYGEGSIIINHGRKAILLKVVNNGDRPIQVCLVFSFRDSSLFQFYS